MTRERTLTGLLAVAAVATLVHCSEQKKSTAGKTCTTGQALQSVGLRGAGMQPKQLALTFDDGPGPRTKALSAFLKNEGIEAAFFVNGKMVDQNGGEILQQLVADGHIIGNHTETHRSLTGVSEGVARPPDADVLAELAATDAKIAPYVQAERLLFRPPYGDFDDTTLAALATSPMNKYVGPVLWDIGDRMDEANGRAADWDCWDDGSDGKRTPMKECGDLYLNEIRRANWGVVLLHDPWYNELDPEQAGTVEMVMYMVPILKQEGFTFVRVDKIPDVANLLPPLPPENTEPPPSNVTTDQSPTTPPPAGDEPCP